MTSDNQINASQKTLETMAEKMAEKMTLANFLGQEIAQHRCTPSLAKLMNDIAGATQRIAAITARGALDDLTGKLNQQNVQGETQMQLDVITNEVFIDTLANNGSVAGLASEEMEHTMPLNAIPDAGEFLVVFDPLDGSSNIPVNVSVGSIFSVLSAPVGRSPEDADYLQTGQRQLAAGYAIYGPATMLVLSLGHGTHGFTLDPESKLYRLTHADIRIPSQTSEYAINASNKRYWEEPVWRYIEDCKAGVTGIRQRDFNMRWVASMVADVHRIMMRGGVYLYPRDNKLPAKAGRLRLLYEANPMSYLVQHAGGKSTTGRQSILEVMPEQIHQRVPVMIGSADEVSIIERYHADADSGLAEKGLSPLFGDRSLFMKMQ